MKIRNLTGIITLLAAWTMLSAYNGGNLWLHYKSVPENVKAGYINVCQSVVLGDATSPVLLNAKSELDLALPALIGITPSTVDGPGAIVLASAGSPSLPAGINTSALVEGGFIIKSEGGKTYIAGTTDIGVLHGVFHLLRLMQTTKPISNLNIVENPYFPRRILENWENHWGFDGSRYSTERVYPSEIDGGEHSGEGRVFRLEDYKPGLGNDLTRITQFCRLAASMGYNGIVLDNVNTYKKGKLNNYKILQSTNITNLSQNLYRLMLSWGLKMYWSVSYASPVLVGGFNNSDASKDPAKQFWIDKANEIAAVMPQFGGFLMKADSEGEAGPSAYDMTQEEGSTPMAEALAPHGFDLIWRTFIYGQGSADIAMNAYEEFDGLTFHESVQLRMKDGPRDFQTREMPHPVAILPGSSKHLELQITQEYTGHDVHLNWLVPHWKEILDFDHKMGAELPAGYAGSQLKQILRGTWDDPSGISGISNFSRSDNWTGHLLAQANAFGYGRLTWNPDISEDEIIDDWMKMTFPNGYSNKLRYILKNIMKKSYETYEDYTSPLGIWMVTNGGLGDNGHFSPNYDGRNNKEDYINAQSDGIGVDRTKATGSGMVEQYTPEVTAMFENIATVPEKYLLCLHHVPWTHQLKRGPTVIQYLLHSSYRGVHQVEKWIADWAMISDEVDSELHAHVASKFAENLEEAKDWHSAFKSFLSKYYNKSAVCNMVLDPGTAQTAAVGASISISAQLKDQSNSNQSGTIHWSVDNGGIVNPASGASTSFSAAAAGVYTVTATTEDSIKSYVKVYVGDWGATAVPVKHTAARPNISVLKKAGGMEISVPFKSDISIIRVDGTIVKKFRSNGPAVHFWNSNRNDAGMYIVHVHNGKHSLTKKIILN